MTRAQAEAIGKALAAADLETLRTMRAFSEAVELALVTARARLVQVETDRQRAVVAALAEDTK